MFVATQRRQHCGLHPRERRARHPASSVAVETQEGSHGSRWRLRTGVARVMCVAVWLHDGGQEMASASPLVANRRAALCRRIAKE